VATQLIEAEGDSTDPVVRAVQVALQMDRKLLGMQRTVAADIQADLAQARLEIIGKLAVVTKDWQRWQLDAVLDETTRQLETWESRTRTNVQTGLTNAAVEGETLALDTLNAGGQPQPYLRPTTGFAHLTAQYAYSADLIKGVSQSTIAKVNTELRRAAMALDPPFEVMQRLGPVTGKGAFASAFHRAEAITRTEMGRSYSASNHATQLELGKLNPGLRKKWLAVVDARTRGSHIAANDQERAQTEPYLVAGERLMYPKDPSGSAENTIMCRCVSMPWHPSWNEPLPADQPPPPTTDPAVTKMQAKGAEFQHLTREISDWLRRYNLRNEELRNSGQSATATNVERDRWGREADAFLKRLGAVRNDLYALMARTPEMLARLTSDDVALLARLRTMVNSQTAMTTTAPIFDFLTAGKPLERSISAIRTQIGGLLGSYVQWYQVGTVPLADRVMDRPPRKSIKQDYYDRALAIGSWMETQGYRTTWTGEIVVGGAGSGAAAAYWPNSSIHLSRNVNQYSDASKDSVLMHELLHGTSKFTGGQQAMIGMAGWEEGVVEMNRQLLQPLYNAATGKPATGYDTYQQYTRALEVLRAGIDMAPEEFYPALIRIKVDDRPAWVASQLTLSGGEISTAFATLMEER
jgi:hypothetical protein